MEESEPFLLGWRDESHQQVFPTPSHLLTLAHHKDLSRFIAGGLGLGGLDLLEELLEDPQEGLIIPGTEHLGDEPTTLAQELTGQLQGHQGQISCSRKKEEVRE